MKIHSPVSKNIDERGEFICFISERLREYRDLNYTVTSAGNTRGDHYHKDTNELFIMLSGEIELTIEKVENDEITGTEKYTFSAYDMFEIEPYENHTIIVTSDCTWISLLSKPFDDSNMDFYKVKKGSNRD